MCRHALLTKALVRVHARQILEQMVDLCARDEVTFMLASVYKCAAHSLASLPHPSQRLTCPPMRSTGV